MTITPIAFYNALGTTPTETYADLATDKDLRSFHPDIDNSRWRDKSTFRDTLSASFDQLLVDLAQMGWDAALIGNTAKNRAWFKTPVILGALVIMCRDFRGEKSDRWDLLLKEYQDKYDALVRSAVVEYDADGDGTISTDEEETETGVVLVR